MSVPPRMGFEPWAWFAFALVGLTLGLLLFLGCRTGGPTAVLVYRQGPLWLGLASAVLMTGGLLWSARRRPLLQRGRVWPLGLLGGSLWVCSLPIAYPSSHEGKFSATHFSLPFAGPARVLVGGEERMKNRFLFDPSRRFGSVFAAEAGGPLTVLAPAAARVAARAEGELVLCVAEAEYLFFEGLEPGSCALEPGAEVSRGQVLASAAGPLTVFLQDGLERGRAEGVPMRYFGYRSDGRVADSGVPIPPQVVVNLAAR
ncbi:MAG: hypothetical protein EXS08_11730 [Planctomycetes bacterium]|nr:hypothetical protein [Planctomycetota bacterium]